MGVTDLIIGMAVQITACAVGLALWKRRVRVMVAGEGAAIAPLWTDVWGPLMLSAPFAASVVLLEHSVAGVGWIGVGGCAAACMAVVGVMLVIGSAKPRAVESLGGGFAVVAWVGAGALLLLVGAAQVLSLWIGQAVFAVAALLLWMNTPGESALRATPSDADAARRASGLFLAFIVISGAQIAALLWMGKHAAPWWALVQVAYTIGALFIAVPAGLRIRMSAWTAVSAVLFGLGMLALRRTVPAIIHSYQSDHPSLLHGPDIAQVAIGLGRYAPEAMVLLAAGAGAGAAVIVQARIGVRGRRWIGVIIALSALSLIIWRITMLALTELQGS